MPRGVSRGRRLLGGIRHASRPGVGHRRITSGKEPRHMSKGKKSKKDDKTKKGKKKK